VDRENFGELIATLREDLGWTQAQLAQALDQPESAVSIMERGARKHFGPDLLYRLANALQLTTLERREFFLAASGADENGSCRHLSPNAGGSTCGCERIAENLTALAARLRFPCYLLDPYGEIVAANASTIDLLQAPMERAPELAATPGGLTLIHFIYDEDVGLRRTAAENWDGAALTVTRAFREATLRYRGTPYFRYLMKRFRNPRLYPAFDRYWRRAAALEEDRASTVNSFSYRHSAYGWLDFHVSALVSATAHGDLYLCQCLPVDEHTSEVCRGIVQRVGTGAYRFASWPEKRMV
jgi:transcriptional regulator with XRE-family HTH domain